MLEGVLWYIFKPLSEISYVREGFCLRLSSF